MRMGQFRKFSQIWANLGKFWKNHVILLKISQKIGPIGIWMGHFFLKNWYLYGYYFQIPQRDIPTKTNLE